jgi:hypothetical protein
MVPLVGILATIGVVAFLPVTEVASRVLLHVRLEPSCDLRTSGMSTTAHEITSSLAQGPAELAMDREVPDVEHDKVLA